MDKGALANRIKTNPGMKVLYKALGSAALNALKLTVRESPNTVLFTSFGGKRFDDSPRVIYEKMLGDSRFDRTDIVWGFHSPESYDLPRGRKLKVDSLEYFRCALSAGAWVTNSGIQRGIPFRGKRTYYLNTWHGTPIKEMGKDVSGRVDSSEKKLFNCISGFCVQGDHDEAVFSEVFGIPSEKMLRVGYPRDDELMKVSAEARLKARSNLGIRDGQIAILYAPTFRDFVRGEDCACELRPPLDLKRWESFLGDNYVVLFRAHYEVVRTLDIPAGDSFARDVSSYPNLNELIIASDMLVSDYSSVFFDYSVTGKPMLHFCYDFDEYNEHRGLYFDIREWIDGACDEAELLEAIVSASEHDESRKTLAFRDAFVKYRGESAAKCLDALFEGMSRLFSGSDFAPR